MPLPRHFLLLLLPALIPAQQPAAGDPPSPPRSGATATPHACEAPFAARPWCNASLPLARRSELLVAEMTLPELISQMSGGMPAIPRLGVPAYHCAQQPSPPPPPPSAWALHLGPAIGP